MTKSNMPGGRRGPAFGAGRGRSGSRGRIFGIPAGLSLGAEFYNLTYLYHVQYCIPKMTSLFVNNRYVYIPR